MNQLTAKMIGDTWKMKIADANALEDMRREAPTLTDPTNIRIRDNTKDTDRELHLEFINLQSASSDAEGVQFIKRLIINWLHRISSSVQKFPNSNPDSLEVRISRTRKFTEAAVPILRRDPKTNTAKRVYKCIGGIKDGKKVADKEQCLKVPNFFQRVKLSMAKRSKAGQIAKAKKKTRITNITAKKIRRFNKRLTKSRGGF